jgi:hypothetical protein
MPTGYTASLHKGDQSVEGFLKGLARGMGFLITMRDEPADAPIPDKIEPGNYYADRIETLTEELDELRAMSPDQIETACRADYEEKLASYRAIRKERLGVRVRYEGMIDRLASWSPEHHAMQELRDFGLSQLRTACEFDCSTSYMEEPKLGDPHEWHLLQISHAQMSIERSKEEYAKEVKRAAKHTECLTELRKEIASLKSEDA